MIVVSILLSVSLSGAADDDQDQAMNAIIIPITVPTLPAAHSRHLGLWYRWKWSTRAGFTKRKSKEIHNNYINKNLSDVYSKF